MSALAGAPTRIPELLLVFEILNPALVCDELHHLFYQADQLLNPLVVQSLCCVQQLYRLRESFVSFSESVQALFVSHLIRF